MFRRLLLEEVQLISTGWLLVVKYYISYPQFTLHDGNAQPSNRSEIWHNELLIQRSLFLHRSEPSQGRIV